MLRLRIAISDFGFGFRFRISILDFGFGFRVWISLSDSGFQVLVPAEVLVPQRVVRVRDAPALQPRKRPVNL